jgi:hypothetical protein
MISRMTRLVILILLCCTHAFAQLTSSVVCKADPGQSYVLYIPSRGNKTVLPVVYLFDPHGDGSLPVKKYRSLAEAYGFILVGSNNSKNGNDWQVTENIWRRLSEDTRARLKLDERRLYTCGFSGGAKVAGFIALQHTGIKGVIAGGAALPDGVPAGQLPFSFTAIAGEGDMNLTELVAVNSQLDRTRTRHRLIIFDGKHEWAPERIMDLAFAGWQLDAMREGTLQRDHTFINTCLTKSKARIAHWYTTGQLLKAGLECQLFLGLLEGLTTETSWFSQQLTSLAHNPQYKKQQGEQDALLAREQQMKEGYMQHFQQPDNAWWTATIHALQKKAGEPTAERSMYQRLLAYLSLAFYSLSNRSIMGNDNSGGRYFVELYKLTDPTNSEAWYLSAILHAREKDPQAAEKDLLKAVQWGFRDKERLDRQPEFNTINKSGIIHAQSQL